MIAAATVGKYEERIYSETEVFSPIRENIPGASGMQEIAQGGGFFIAV
jgi:hypothetical protein